ncbi:hypothetical protein DAEQUDRAFT_738849 [Daedalea quercina L-15889]|uniref:Uncharacterized protein n=1 Tax=Daedalea quercina L-15889 TaxID=1314783 RepID=A0A165PJU4_9APHY|nr:hypothetical protein DAEQUDRAFT_738849 [Daedalea quercina L-15889]
MSLFPALTSLPRSYPWFGRLIEPIAASGSWPSRSSNKRCSYKSKRYCRVSLDTSCLAVVKRSSNTAQVSLTRVTELWRYRQYRSFRIESGQGFEFGEPREGGRRLTFHYDKRRRSAGNVNIKNIDLQKRGVSSIGSRLKIQAESSRDLGTSRIRDSCSDSELPASGYYTRGAVNVLSNSATELHSGHKITLEPHRQSARLPSFTLRSSRVAMQPGTPESHPGMRDVARIGWRLCKGCPADLLADVGMDSAMSRYAFWRETWPAARQRMYLGHEPTPST